jgi:nitrate reductase alpha subunit
MTNANAIKTNQTLIYVFTIITLWVALEVFTGGASVAICFAVAGLALTTVNLTKEEKEVNEKAEAIKRNEALIRLGELAGKIHAERENCKDMVEYLDNMMAEAEEIEAKIEDEKDALCEAVGEIEIEIDENGRWKMKKDVNEEEKTKEEPAEMTHEEKWQRHFELMNARIKANHGYTCIDFPFFVKGLKVIGLIGVAFITFMTCVAVILG